MTVSYMIQSRVRPSTTVHDIKTFSWSTFFIKLLGLENQIQFKSDFVILFKFLLVLTVSFGKSKQISQLSQGWQVELNVKMRRSQMLVGRLDWIGHFLVFIFRIYAILRPVHSLQTM